MAGSRRGLKERGATLLRRSLPDPRPEAEGHTPRVGCESRNSKVTVDRPPLPNQAGAWLGAPNAAERSPPAPVRGVAWHTLSTHKGCDRVCSGSRAGGRPTARSTEGVAVWRFFAGCSRRGLSGLRTLRRRRRCVAPHPSTRRHATLAHELHQGFALGFSPVHPQRLPPTPSIPSGRALRSDCKVTPPLSVAALRLTAHSCTKGCLLCYFALSCLRPSSRS